jgi:plastocyanin
MKNITVAKPGPVRRWGSRHMEPGHLVLKDNGSEKRRPHYPSQEVTTMRLREQAPKNPTGSGRSRFAITGRRVALAALIGILALALVACGSDGDSGGESRSYTVAQGDEPTVVIEDLAFEPETLTVEPGDTVTWVWNDGSVEHDVSGDDFRSEIMSEGTFRQRFDEPGTYDYVCSLHPTMRATIEVTR